MTVFQPPWKKKYFALGKFDYFDNRKIITQQKDIQIKASVVNTHALILEG